MDLILQKRSGLFILKCQNSTLPLPTHIADNLFVTTGLTTKPNHSGLGTKIVKDIVDRNHGFLDFVYEGASYDTSKS